MSLRFFDYDHPKNAIYDNDEVIFANLSDEGWSHLLSHMERRKFPRGATLIELGQIDRSLYFVVSGAVAVVKRRFNMDKEVAIIGAGSVFGEMAFLDGGPRSAAIKAREAVEVLVLPYSGFESLLAWEPHLACKLLFDVGRILSLRLRRAQGEL